MTEGYQVKIGERARALREAKGISLREFSAQADFNPNVLSRIERGRQNITLETLFKLARSLGTTPEQLLEGLS